MVDRTRLTNLLIDGLPLPCPDAGVIIAKNDLDSEDTGRDESGYMHRLVVRYGVKTWEFPYAVISAADFAYIESLIANKPEFQVDFWGVTTTAYCAKLSATIANVVTGDYRDVTLKIIEC